MPLAGRENSASSASALQARAYASHRSHGSSQQIAYFYPKHAIPQDFVFNSNQGQNRGWKDASHSRELFLPQPLADINGGAFAAALLFRQMFTTFNRNCYVMLIPPCSGLPANPPLAANFSPSRCCSLAPSPPNFPILPPRQHRQERPQAWAHLPLGSLFAHTGPA